MDEGERERIVERGAGRCESDFTHCAAGDVRLGITRQCVGVLCDERSVITTCHERAGTRVVQRQEPDQ